MDPSREIPSISFSAKARRTVDPPISFLIALAKANPDLISFAAGLVDPLTLPVTEIRGATQGLLSNPQLASDVLQYGTTIGYGPLRQLLLQHLEKLDGKTAAELSLTAENIVLTNGSQQALYIIGDMLLDPNDIVIAANPTYFVYAGALQSLGVSVRAVDMDNDGMLVEKVAKELESIQKHGQLHRVKFIYCTSYFQNPTGLTLSLERRKRLVEIARHFSRDHRIMILEDAAYRELRYDGQDIPSIKSFDPQNRFVISCYTFSKPFAPGIKLGWAVLPAELTDQLVRQKGNHDFGSSNLCQHIAHEVLSSGAYMEHVYDLRESYRKKRDATLDALQRHMPRRDDLHWTHAQGGLYVWLTLPYTIHTGRGGEFFRECLKQKVLYVPGEYCFQPDEKGFIPQNHMRLSFGVVKQELIEPGIERLAWCVSQFLRDPAACR